MATERTDFARQLRRSATDAERALWQRLRAQQLGVKFRRQVPFGPYVLDFYCLQLRVAVEVDGGQHNANMRDAARDAFLRERGIRVLRFWNHDVLQNMAGVAQQIESVLRGLPLPNPPLREGREN